MNVFIIAMINNTKLAFILVLLPTEHYLHYSSENDDNNINSRSNAQEI